MSSEKRMKKSLLLIVFTLLLINLSISAQSEMKFEMDYARFHYDSTATYLELYYELIPDGMQTAAVAGGSQLEAVVSVILKDQKTDSLVIKKNWKLNHVINPNDSSGVQSLAGVLAFVVAKGEYKLEVSAYDSKNPAFKKIINENLSIKPFGSDKFSLSDIELSRGIKTSDADPKSIFYKNTLEVTPNPNALFSENSPVLFFYSELYNLKLKDMGASFILQKSLYNSNGKQIYLVNKPIKQAGNSVVEIGIINLSKYPSGAYTLNLSLIDSTTKLAYVSTKKFFLYNPKIAGAEKLAVGNLGLSGSEFALMTSEECDDLMSKARYIATDVEQSRYKKLDSLKAKQQFLYNFWLTRDNDPNTPINEFKEDYIKRVEYANLHFKLNKKQGYLTDRGRVLLIYGEPDSKDYFPNESNFKPHEIWFYNQIEGGVQFIFGDPTGFGNYELLHSTKRGEYRDDNWEQRLRTQ